MIGFRYNWAGGPFFKDLFLEVRGQSRKWSMVGKKLATLPPGKLGFGGLSKVVFPLTYYLHKQNPLVDPPPPWWKGGPPGRVKKVPN